MNLEVNNFSAERLVMGQKVEAPALRVRADNQGYVLRGDVKINGIPALLEYRKQRDQTEAEVRVAATLDEAGRARLGFDLSAAMSAARCRCKINGRVPLEGGDSRYSVEADLTPGAHRPVAARLGQAGRTAGAHVVPHDQQAAIDAPRRSGHRRAGASGQGLRRDATASGEIQSANLTELQSLRRRQGHVARRARPRWRAARAWCAATSMTAAASSSRRCPARARRKPRTQSSRTSTSTSVLGTVAGFHGETLRSVDLKMSRRNGNIMSFTLAARLGRDTPLTGDLRGRAGGRNVIYVETKDAGALFRFSDTYPKIFGGEMWMAMDPPTGRHRAAGRHPQYPGLHRARRADARSRRLRQRRRAGLARIRQKSGRRILAAARRFHAHPRPLRDPRRPSCAAR